MWDVNQRATANRPLVAANLSTSSHVFHSDNGAARRFERPMSSPPPRHRVKGEALAKTAAVCLTVGEQQPIARYASSSEIPTC